MATNTVKTSQIQILDNEGAVAKTIALSDGVVCIDGSPIDLGSVGPTEIDLTDTHILVGDATNKAADVAASGGFTLANTGLATLGPNCGYATTATAAGTTVLTVSSKMLQYFTGSTTQTVTLPVVTTLALGWKIRVVNNSSGIVTVNSSGANLVSVVSPGTALEFTCILITGTDAASWDVVFGNADVTAALLAGFSAAPGTVAATDSILGGFNKVAANILVGQFGYTTTATAASTTTLTAASTYNQYFTGVTTQTVVLPVATTLIVGRQFRIANDSTGALTVNSSGSNLVVAITTTQVVIVTCILASGTDAASWSVGLAPIKSVLTGFSSGAGVISAADTVLSAINKLDGNVTALYSPFTSQKLYAPSGSNTVTSSQANIDGVVNQSVTFPHTGTYLFTISSYGFYGAAATNDDLQFRLMIDDVASGLTQTWNFPLNAAQPRVSFCDVIAASITLGARNVRVQAGATNGARVTYDTSVTIRISIIG